MKSKLCFSHDIIVYSLKTYLLPVHDTRGYKPLVDLILKDFGGWSLADDHWNESAFDAEAMVARASSHFVSTVCTFSVTVDFRDDKVRVLKVR